MSPAALELLEGGATPDPSSGLIVPPALALVNELPEPDDIDIESAVVDGNPITAEIPGTINDGELDRTMDGASTLTLVTEDPQRRLIDTSLFKKFAAQEDVHLTLDGRDFALAQISKQSDQFTLTWENRAVNELRKYSQPKKAYRDSMTRAEFVLTLVLEVKGYSIQFYSPELHKQQPIANKRQKQTRTTRNKLRHRGIRGSHVTVKHQRATAEQVNLINRVLDVASSMNSPYPVMVAVLETITQESDVHNDVGHGGVDVGLYNQNVHMGWPASRDVEKDSRAFLSKANQVYKSNPRMKASDIAQAVQRSGAGARYYEQWKDEAIATLKAYGAHGGSGSITLTRFNRFAFRRGTTDGKKEDSWTAIKRLAEEVGWRAFMVDDTLYFIDDDTLMNSAPRMTVSEATAGVVDIDYDLDNGKKVETATVYARAGRWTAPPGTVVELEDMGDPVAGRWLVAEHRRPLFAKDAEVTLKRAQKSKLEPAPTSSTVTLKGSSGIAAVDKAYKKAQEISKKKWGYKWGGGHGSFAGPYDCSGAVSAVLHEAGWLKKPESTGPLANWGHAGVGKFLTVWVHNGGAGGGHTFIEFHMPGKGVEHWGTGRWGKSWDGAGFNPQLHPHAGFSPRHWPGS